MALRITEDSVVIWIPSSWKPQKQLLQKPQSFSTISNQITEKIGLGPYAWLLQPNGFRNYNPCKNASSHLLSSTRPPNKLKLCSLLCWLLSPSLNSRLCSYFQSLHDFSENWFKGIHTSETWHCWNLTVILLCSKIKTHFGGCVHQGQRFPAA